jgi:Flp pilus assembly protein TadD
VQRWALSLGLALLTAAAFWGVKDLGFVNYDDPLYVTENEVVRRGLTPQGIAWAFATLRGGNWHPLTWVSHMLDVSVWGLSPAGHHLTSLVLHGANAVLLFWVLAGMTGRRWPSALTAALFAVHPLHVESVAWVAERKDVLSTFFGLLAIRAYHEYAQAPCRGRYTRVLLWFALGLMAKPMLVTLPFVLLLLDFWPLSRTAWTQGDARSARSVDLSSLLREKAPLFMLAAGSCAVTWVAQRQEGAVLALERIPLWARLANAVEAYAGYLGKTLWPLRLAVFYPHPGTTVSLWGASAALLLVAAVTWGAIRWARARPYLPVGWLWYAGTLVPVIGLVQAGSQAMADRYTYLPLIGIFLAVSWGAADLAARLHRGAIPAAVAVLAVLLALAAATRAQTRHWRTSEALFGHAVRVTSADNRLARVLLASALVEQGRLDEAERRYAEALRLKPEDPFALTGMGTVLLRRGEFGAAAELFSAALRSDPNFVLAHHGLGAALLFVPDRLDDALLHSDRALRTGPEDPRTHVNLGMGYERKGDLDRAVNHYRAALRLGLVEAELHRSLARVLVQQGRLDEGVAQYREALRLEPADGATARRLGVALARAGRLPEALPHLREAARLRPDQTGAHYDLAVALDQLGQDGEAEAEYREALRLDPDDAMALGNLGMLLRRAGRPAEAARFLRRALEVRPDDALARKNLAMALWQTGEVSEAREHLREVFRLAPDDPEAAGLSAAMGATDRDGREVPQGRSGGDGHGVRQ